MFIAALFVITKKWKQTNQLISEQTNKVYPYNRILSGNKYWYTYENGSIDTFYNMEAP